MTTALRIAIIGSSRYPIAEPFAGGLEAHVWHLARLLGRRGHQVTLFAAEGSDADVAVETMAAPVPQLSVAARADVSMPAEWVMAEHHAYLSLMLDLAGRRSRDFDIVHNHSLHYLPMAMSSALRQPVLSTLHTPPTPWLESALQTRYGISGRNLVAVSRHTATAWQPTTGPVEVVPNGVDHERWPLGAGGGPLIWFGRLVAEKGADVAVAAARLARRELVLAGPIVDGVWFEQNIAPHLGEQVRYLGHLNQDELARAIGAASVALVTPTWEEPYGLVVAEALACGTPVAGFARGGIPEIVDRSCAVLVEPDDVAALARAIPVAEALSRSACRTRAEQHCSLDLMVDRYEAIYARLLG